MLADIADQVRAALATEPRVDLLHHPLRLAAEGGFVTIEGEVADVAAKKLALERAAQVSGVSGIIDRLHVEPAVEVDDQELRQDACRALAAERALSGCSIHCAGELVRGGGRGAVEVSVRDGVVTLDGEVPTSLGKRMAGILCWQLEGARDVVDALEVTLEPEDSPGAIAEAVLAAVERDPELRDTHLRLSVCGGVVTLRGRVASARLAARAERIAWMVFAVDRVINQLEVG